MGHGLKKNRLGLETSPYLLQHAGNPVDWFPWGAEAFEKARAEGRPIFLSVGYSTCYWCHVMERESFENEAIAAAMNRDFVCIKVDREERPDVDQFYMTAVQLLTRSGGWPMSVFLTPDLRPFYGGTYFPPTDVTGRMGFPTLLGSIAEAWADRREEVEKGAESLIGAIKQYAAPAGVEVKLRVDEGLVGEVVGRGIAGYDGMYGGFGGAPKFPQETLLELLIGFCLGGEPTPAKAEIRRMVEHTMERMARGGIHDQLGGGFHRYSTDAKWLVPHFEIMLYDNAMLLGVYAWAANAWGRADFRQVARGIAEFVLSEMTGPAGEFYTALDAEVEGREGASYLWTRDQIAEVLSDQEAAVFNRVYGVDQGPNFADPHHGAGEPETNVLWVAQTPAEVAKQLGVMAEDVEKELSPAREKLLAARRRRKQPMRDTKVITGWAAMMARGLALAGRMLGEGRYTEAAVRGMEFLLGQHRREGEGFWRSSREMEAGRREAKVAGFLDDYASVLQALLELKRATGEERWLAEAKRVEGQMWRRFGSEVGALYFTDAGAGDLPARQMVAADSPLPSGNAVAAACALELGRPERARGIIAAFAEGMDTYGEAMPSMVAAAMKYVREVGPMEVEPTGNEARLEEAGDLVTVEVKRVSAGLKLRLKIREGYHIGVSEVPAGLCPTQVKVMREGRALEAEVKYPAATREMRLPDGAMMGVYEGEVEIEVRGGLEATAVGVWAQPCSEVACLARVYVEGRV